jgi:hypothetical protein
VRFRGPIVRHHPKPPPCRLSAREFHKEAPEWKKQWLKTRKVFYTFVAGQFIPTAPKILRKGDAAVVEAGLRPPVDPALPTNEEMKEQGQGQGEEVASLNVEEECERRLMFYDEEEGTGEQLAWGVYPSGPPLQQVPSTPYSPCHFHIEL